MRFVGAAALVLLAAVVRVMGSACAPGKTDCPIDENVGSTVIYEDERVRVWNFTLAPNESTSLHRHDCDYHFVALQPSTLEVFGANGERLFDFLATGTLGFKLDGDELVQLPPSSADASFTPIRVPRTHTARNIGSNIYRELLFESRRCSTTGDEL